MKLLRWTLAGASAYVIYKYTIGKKAQGEDVFVAIRIGDRMGILNPPTEGLDAGDAVHLRGEWIPRDRAQAHGGEAMSVLHFTHHPIGFLCIETPSERCFS